MREYRQSVHEVFAKFTNLPFPWFVSGNDGKVTEASTPAQTTSENKKTMPYAPENKLDCLVKSSISSYLRDELEQLRAKVAYLKICPPYSGKETRPNAG